MSKYVVKRKDVCAGQLLKTDCLSFKIFDGNGYEISKEQFDELDGSALSFFEGLNLDYTEIVLRQKDDGDLRKITAYYRPHKPPINIDFSIYGSYVCRGMLFDVNEDGLANDLIYDTPFSYPIKGKTKEIDVDSQFVIDRYVELEELLKYLGYGEDLTQKDLKRIFRKLITHDRWLMHHTDLFGWKKLMDGTYGSSEIQILPTEMCDYLSVISCYRNGHPYPEEPGYSFIKKKK